MSVHEVVRAIRDIHRKHMFEQFDADRERFLSRYELTAAERQALLGNDYKTLYESGCHPMSVLFFSQVNHLPMPDYLAIIGAAEGRVTEFRGLHGQDPGSPR